MTRTAFERVAAFDPNDLPRSIERFEQSVRKKFVENDASPAANLYSIGLSVRTSLYAARFGELVRCDPTAAAFTVLLPRPDDPKADCIRIANIGTSTNTITLLPAFSDTFVNSTTSYALAGAKAAVEIYPDRFAKNWIVTSGTQSATTISPASLSADQTDYSPAGWSGATYVRLNPTTGISLFSFDANVSVKLKYLVHVGGDFDIRIHNDSFVTSVAANRVAGAKPNDIYLLRGFTQALWCDDVSQRWRPV